MLLTDEKEGNLCFLNDLLHLEQTQTEYSLSQIKLLNSYHTHICSCYTTNDTDNSLKNIHIFILIWYLSKIVGSHSLEFSRKSMHILYSIDVAEFYLTESPKKLY